MDTGGALFIGSTIYRGSRYGRLHPLSIERVPAVIDLCRAMGWLPDASYRTSPRAKPRALEAFHTPDYVAALQAAEAAQAVDPEVRARHGLGTLSNPVFPEMFRRPATAAGGGLLAASLVRGGGVVYNPGGGTHHAFPDRAAGFCFLNEPVLTIRQLLAQGCRRVAYVDIDAHHGDGVEAAFDGSDSVRLVSVHEAGRWPFTGRIDETAGGAAFNLPVPKGFHDDEFALVLEGVILPAVAAFRPDAIFLQCGADAVTEDPLSRLALSNRAHWRAVAALRPLAPRMIVSGGGGYNPWTVARLWSGVWATLSGQEIPDRLPAEAAEVLGRLAWARKGPPGPELLSTLRDAPREGRIRAEVRAGVATLARRIAATA
ncbi:acetoin utilization protein AcuC [Roseivivax isoporae]|uniref:Acetoin utilization protein AcuC n=1 Tax=Roseivivax isoporae LMG 25204 TaxID=1449351 RepID=X7FDE1_9RHOB|nr:acetoin utilization protein AcuC [Roseivivax isoporae]ETX30086.1 acetoin utilization protein [Roseivivax isoporae LMG 25204]